MLFQVVCWSFVADFSGVLSDVVALFTLAKLKVSHI